MRTFLTRLVFVLIILDIFSTDVYSINAKYINTRYVGGENSLRLFIQQNIIYPDKSAEKGIVGTSIASMTIKNTGEIVNIKILNSLDADIDKVVIETLRKTKDNWLKDPNVKNDTTFFFQILFKSDKTDFSKQKVNSENLIGECTLIGYGCNSCKKVMTDEKLNDNDSSFC
jgi:hypothetical protein